MIRTRICDILGIKYPILEGGMGLSQGANLAAEVSNAGALGCVGRPVFTIGFFGGDARPMYRDFLQDMLKHTEKPFSVNIPVGSEQVDRDQLIDLVIEERKKDARLAKQLVAMVTSAGNGAPLVDKIKSTGLVHIHKVSTIRQAQKMESAGVDAVIVLGWDGGGHIHFDKVGTIVLLPMVADSVKIPVIAAGGFCDGKGLVAALALGAEGIEMGTRFVASKEIKLPAKYKAAVVKAEAKDPKPEVGRFSDIRMLSNNWYFQRLKDSGGKEEHDLDEKARKDMLMEHALRFKKFLEDFDPEDCPMMTGQVCGRIKSIESGRDIVENIMKEAESMIQNLGGRLV